MSTRAGSKQGRPTIKSTVKTPGKDQNKGDKQSANLLEIVPGRFNENDWLSLLENDDTEDFIADIFDGIWSNTSKQIEQIYIRRQLVPFTVMMTENALSNVIQWAFLQRDTVKPADGDFWMDDSEPIPCIMDNWGEGVVPACREERSQKVDESMLSLSERPVTAPVNGPTLEAASWIERPSTGFSVHSTERRSRSGSQRKASLKISQSGDQFEKSQHEPPSVDHQAGRLSARKEDPWEEQSVPFRSQRQSNHHDILVIHTQPPRLEPLSDLFCPPELRTNHSSNPSKVGRIIAPRAVSQLGADAVASTTVDSDTSATKSLRKATESKLFDEEHIEESIARAPAAAHAMLKSILSRPPGYRELELDDYGQVVAIAKIDPDKLALRSIRVKCDVVKPRKAVLDSRPSLPSKPPQSLRSLRSESKLTTEKLVLPEQSTEVGDLIQPVPGVLYEDSRLKKGDPRRYQSGSSKYRNFHDETRSLRPVGQRGDMNILRAAHDFIRQSKQYSDMNVTDEESAIPKLHRLSRIPPIMPESNTSSA